MVGVVTSKLARAADLSTFPLVFLDESGVGAGPFANLTVVCDSSGVPLTSINSPYQFTPKAPGQHNISLTTVTSLSVPSGATYAWVQVYGGTGRYTTDGVTTPTTTVGMTLLQNTGPLFLSGPTVLANFRMIGTAGSTMDVEYAS